MCKGNLEVPINKYREGTVQSAKTVFTGIEADEIDLADTKFTIL